LVDITGANSYTDRGLPEGGRGFFSAEPEGTAKRNLPMLLTLFSYCAATLTTVSFLPQAIKTIKTKDTSSISLGMYIMFTFGVVLWLLYGLGTGQLPIVLSNAITAVLAVIILVFKIDGLRKQKQGVQSQ
jgi:MtN3 and saliva related transmembrane protein